MIHEPITYRAGSGFSARSAEADPIETELIRHGLASAANLIKSTLVRTAFSPIIYEVLDFAVVLYDRDYRLLAQAPTLPLFMGSLSFCVEGAVAAVGGEEALEPGDIILANDPYVTGSHPQDAAVVMPIFLGDGTLLGYSAIKAHWLDIGAKALYCTDTTDVYQEGVVFPGVKLFRRGERVEDIYRIVLANSRLAGMVDGDLNAEIAAVHVGAAALVRLVERHGLETFRNCVERMYDHGEAVARAYIEQIPDGRYIGRGEMDDDGVSDESIPFEVVLEIDGDQCRLDFSNAPDARPGPVNCPIASTVSAARVVITMLSGGGEAPNEGHFRPVEVIARPGSMFHCLRPAPCFLYGWPAMQATEAVLHAFGQAVPERGIACSGGDLASVLWWGRREKTGEFWGDGSPHPIGQGASAGGDGAAGLLHFIEAATRFSPTEVWEARNPWLIEKFELATDSCGPGRQRGGLGPDVHFRMLEDVECTATLERTKNAPWGLNGGRPGRPNAGRVRYPDGTVRPVAKATGLAVPKGAVFEIACGGGGGYGDPAERDVQAVLDDLRDGCISEAHAREHYPHAFAAAASDERAAVGYGGECGGERVRAGGRTTA